MLNSLINFFKYPVAILSLLWVVELGRIFFNMLISMIEKQEQYDSFFIGMGIYLLMWFILFRNKIGRWFAVLEHELTHTIFAFLSFNKILELRAHFRGGYMVYHGGKSKGNWLITISPYFFPTLAIVVIGLIHLASPQYYSVLIGLLGYSFVHHIHNTIVSIHPRQIDLQQVGYFFSFLFLPSANLAMMIIILSQIPNDSIYLQTAIDYLYDVSLYYIDMVHHALKL